MSDPVSLRIYGEYELLLLPGFELSSRLHVDDTYVINRGVHNWMATFNGKNLITVNTHNGSFGGCRVRYQDGNGEFYFSSGFCECKIREVTTEFEPNPDNEVWLKHIYGSDLMKLSDCNFEGVCKAIKNIQDKLYSLHGSILIIGDESNVKQLIDNHNL